MITPKGFLRLDMTESMQLTALAPSERCVCVCDGDVHFCEKKPLPHVLGEGEAARPYMEVRSSACFGLKSSLLSSRCCPGGVDVQAEGTSSSFM